MAQVTRRSFLSKGIIGGALLTGGGAASLWMRGTVLVDPRAPLKVLSRREYSVLVAIADRMTPGGDGFPSPRQVQVAEKVDANIAGLHPANVAELKQGLVLFESALAGFLFDRRITPFTQLDGEDQDRVIDAWRDSRVAIRRSLFKAFKSLTTAAYYGSPEVYEAIGYPGPPEILPG